MTDKNKTLLDQEMLGLVNAAVEIMRRIAEGKENTPEITALASEWMTRVSDLRGELAAPELPEMPQTGELQVGDLLYEPHGIGMRQKGQIVALEDGNVVIDTLQGRAELDLGQVGIELFTEEQSEWMLKCRGAGE